MATRDIDVTLRVEDEDGGLHGTVHIEDEPARDFSGWLGLFCVLEALVEQIDGERAT
jgi:hypothetical protein